MVGVAQLVERRSVAAKAAGSCPVAHPIILNLLHRSAPTPFGVGAPTPDFIGASEWQRRPRDRAPSPTPKVCFYEFTFLKKSQACRPGIFWKRGLFSIRTSRSGFGFLAHPRFLRHL